MKPLEQCSDEYLIERLEGLSKNLFFLKGKLQIDANIREAFFETKTELDRRNLSRRLEVEKLIRPEDPEPIFHENCLIRYSKHSWLNDLLLGRVYFTPASEYENSPNKARKDTELERHWLMPDDVVEIQGTEYPASNIHFKKSISKSGGEWKHFHTLCLCYEESPKLQRDFEKDGGYIVIKDPSLFARTIGKALKLRNNSIRWRILPVKYYDDRSPPSLNTYEEMLFSKTLKYFYQREVRFAILGVKERDEPFTIEVDWPNGLFSEIKSFELNPPTPVAS